LATGGHFLVEPGHLGVLLGLAVGRFTGELSGPFIAAATGRKDRQCDRQGTRLAASTSSLVQG
jgi:hypothetical protein